MRETGTALTDDGHCHGVRLRNFRIELAHSWHAFELVRTLRPEDTAEILAVSSCRLCPLMRSVDNSTERFSLFLNQDILGIGGFSPSPQHGDNCVSIWGIFSSKVINYRLNVLGILISLIDDAQSKYNFIYNYMSEDNYKSMKWIRKLGFVFSDKKFKIKEITFIPFQWSRTCV